MPPAEVPRRRWILVAAVVVGAALVASLLASGLGDDPRLLRSPLVGRPAPPFALDRLDGPGSVSLASLRGQVVVINFWASWCGPCRQEHTALDAAWNRYREHGAVVLGITYQNEPEDALAFRDELGGDWPLLDDHGSRTALAYGVTGVPETFFIDAEGRVAHKHYGAVTYEVLTQWISKLLRRGTSP